MAPLMTGGADEETRVPVSGMPGAGDLMEQRVLMSAADMVEKKGEVAAAEGHAGGGRGAGVPAARLTEFLDLATLQDIQDSLAMVAQVKASILDTSGQPLTQTTVSERFSNRSAAIAAARKQKGDTNLDQPFVAPIIVNDVQLGTIVMEPAKAAPIKASQAGRLAKKLGVPAEQVRAVIEAMNEEGMGQRTASVQFLYLLANALSRLCSQEMQLRQRIQELTALFNISSMLTGTRGLQQILDRVTRGVAEALHVKSCSLRLLDEGRDELVIKSVYGLSEAYLKKGPVTLGVSTIDRAVLTGQTVYIGDMGSDERVLYPSEAKSEGIVSSLVTGMRFKDRAIGVIRVYTAEPHEFSEFERKLLESIASQAAVAIENARLQEEALEKDRLERQVQIAAEVQRRMMPAKPPQFAGLDIAALYVPCFELGGDFYDFIPLGDHSVGMTVADVVGKGLPASLLMASVRAAMRAQADNVYDLDEIVSRVNKSMSMDMRSNEFITLWYGVLDLQTKQLTYCSAGHEPALLIREGQMRELAVGGMVIGVDPEQRYDKEVVQLQSGDVLWVYTDGVPDAMNYSGEKFGKTRMKESLLKYRHLPAEQICRQMLWETRRFVGLNRRTDDTTIVVVKVT
ncbi:MAG TPA: SpoIIE family protein phosphatase [Phycisphaerae bacterium]|nr:SpoIIE family protein phosphatase [Phycisphaerae bacterium]